MENIHENNANNQVVYNPDFIAARDAYLIEQLEDRDYGQFEIEGDEVQEH